MSRLTYLINEIGNFGQSPIIPAMPLALPRQKFSLNLPKRFYGTFEYEGKIVTHFAEYSFSDRPWGSGYSYDFFDVPDLDICIREDDVLAWTSL